MPRRAAANRREVQPDAVYNNRLVTQLINKVLLDGKKATAERIVYTAFDMVAEKTGEDALSVTVVGMIGFDVLRCCHGFPSYRVRDHYTATARGALRRPCSTVGSESWAGGVKRVLLNGCSPSSLSALRPCSPSRQNESHTEERSS